MMLAITGTGVVSPLGVGTSSFIKAIRDGKSAIRPLSDSMGVSIGAQFASPFVPDIDRKQSFLMDPVSQYAVAAAKESMQMAGLSDLAPTQIGAIMGIGVCGIETIDAAYAELYGRKGRVSPFAIPKIMPCAPASSICMALGIKGPSFCTTSACASSVHAIISGALWLQAGLVDAVVVGGTEAPFAYGLLQAWSAMRVLAADTCRPFSINRRGMVLGEGAGALVLERLSDAKQRGANVLALLRGFSANADSGHIVKPDERSVARAMTLALENAAVAPGDIGHISGHATGTDLNDAVESLAIATVFGDHRPYVSGTKGATGHTLGAAGALEAIICVHALLGQWIPPTLHNLGRDPSCADINISPDAAINATYAVAMSNSFAFGGLNAVLIISAQS